MSAGRGAAGAALPGEAPGCRGAARGRRVVGRAAAHAAGAGRLRLRLFGAGANAEHVARERARYGLDQPIGSAVRRVWLGARPASISAPRSSTAARSSSWSASARPTPPASRWSPLAARHRSSASRWASSSAAAAGGCCPALIRGVLARPAVAAVAAHVAACFVLIAARTGWFPIGGMRPSARGTRAWWPGWPTWRGTCRCRRWRIALPLAATIERVQSQAMARDAGRAVHRSPRWRAACRRGRLVWRDALRPSPRPGRLDLRVHRRQPAQRVVRRGDRDGVARPRPADVRRAARARPVPGGRVRRRRLAVPGGGQPAVRPGAGLGRPAAARGPRPRRRRRRDEAAGGGLPGVHRARGGGGAVAGAARSRAHVPRLPLRAADAAARRSTPRDAGSGRSSTRCGWSSRLEQRYEEDVRGASRCVFFSGGRLVRVGGRDAAGRGCRSAPTASGRDVLARAAARRAHVARRGAGRHAGRARSSGCWSAGSPAMRGGAVDDGARCALAEFVLVLPAIYVVLALRAGAAARAAGVDGLPADGRHLRAVGWPCVARAVRAIVAAERTRDYAAAAVSLGAGHARVLFGHLLPACRGVLAVQAIAAAARLHPRRGHAVVRRPRVPRRRRRAGARCCTRRSNVNAIAELPVDARARRGHLRRHARGEPPDRRPRRARWRIWSRMSVQVARGRRLGGVQLLPRRAEAGRRPPVRVGEHRVRGDPLGQRPAGRRDRLGLGADVRQGGRRRAPVRPRQDRGDLGRGRSRADRRRRHLDRRRGGEEDPARRRGRAPGRRARR